MDTAYGYTQLDSDSCFFVMGDTPETKLILPVLVDDMIATGSPAAIDAFEIAITEAFGTKILGPVQWYSGCNISRTPSKITIDQQAYIAATVAKYNLTACRTPSVPLKTGIDPEVLADEGGSTKELVKRSRSMSGESAWIAKTTRPDAAHSTYMVSRTMHKGNEKTVDMCKHILKYLNGTINYGIAYHKGTAFRSRTNL